MFFVTEEVNVSTISPIGPDELPPPYQQAGMPMVTCRVCQAMIDISGKREQHVVKCSECNEATVSFSSQTCSFSPRVIPIRLGQNACYHDYLIIDCILIPFFVY